MSAFRSINSQEVVCIYINDKTHIEDNVTLLRIDPSVTRIKERAFDNKKFLTTIESFPSNLSSIGDYAFHGCKSLTSIPPFPKSCTIGKSSFHGCKALTNIRFTQSTYIGSNAFYGCTALKSIPEFPYEIAVCPSAFNGCTGLIDKQKIADDIVIINVSKKSWKSLKRNRETVKLCLERLHSTKIKKIEDMTNTEINGLTPGEFAFRVVDMMKNSGWYGQGEKIVDMTGLD